MRILITGAAGIVGQALHVYLQYRGHTIIPMDIIGDNEVLSLDLRDKTTVLAFIQQYSPALIIHLAAIKDLVFCEQQPAIAHATNYGVTATLVEACLAFNIRIVFFSSDYVFGQSDQHWGEMDTPCPTTQYGRDKAASEQLIQATLSDYAIVRTAQLYGFSGDFVDLVRAALTAQQPFTAFANLINCPTWLVDLQVMVGQIIQQQLVGIFHCVGLQALSRYQYACEIATALHLPQAAIQAVELDFTQDIRPPSVRLDGSATYARLGYYPQTLRENLRYLSFN